MSRYKLAFIQVLCHMQQVIISSFYIGQNCIKHFTIKRANDVRPYDCKPKVCCNFVLCSYPKFVHIRQSPLCKGRGTTKWWKDCFGRHFRLYKIYSIYDVGNEQCSFRYLQIIFISSYTFYIENTIYRDNPPVSLTLTPSFTQGGLLSVQISNIYIGQNINIKADLLGPPVVDPTPVSHSTI